MPIDVHIERLIVDGVAMTVAERGAFAESLTAELTRLLRETPTAGLAPGASVAPYAPAPVVELAAPFDARQAGGAVANAVHSSLVAIDGNTGRAS